MLHERNDEALDYALAHGYRRNGPLLYIPDCPSCSACKPIRVHANSFCPTKSQRRVWRKNSPQLEIDVQPLQAGARHIELFNAHASHVNPESQDVSAQGYVEFIASYAQSKQIEYRMAGELIAVGIVDIGSSSLSSVYFYWDPKLSALSLGTFSALWELDYCRKNSIEYYYLGYWVAACKSMSYKSRFGPYELYDFDSNTWQTGP